MRVFPEAVAVLDAAIPAVGHKLYAISPSRGATGRIGIALSIVVGRIPSCALAANSPAIRPWHHMNVTFFRHFFDPFRIEWTSFYDSDKTSPQCQGRKRRKMKEMDDSKVSTTDLMHLARLALQGKQKDVQLFVRRLVKRYQEQSPALSESLATLLRQAQPALEPSPVLRRGAVVESMPVDLDSRLSLARVENPVQLGLTPNWAPEVRSKLDELVFERRHEAELHRENLTPSRTALFTGPPGVGKTLAARWVAEQLGRPLITLDLSAVMSSFLGRTGNNVRNVLDYAKGVSCVFLLDEFDAIAKRRDDVVEVGELKRLVTVLLQEIDNWPPTGLLIAATNHDDLLDPAVWRRFEIVVRFPMPAEQDVRRAVEMNLGDSGLADRWIRVLGRVFAGASYADIERDLKRVRRQAVLQKEPLEERLRVLVVERAEALKRSERAELALTLVDAGLSQREAHEWTGVSRDTIRKHQDGRR